MQLATNMFCGDFVCHHMHCHTQGQMSSLIHMWLAHWRCITLSIGQKSFMNVLFFIVIFLLSIFTSSWCLLFIIFSSSLGSIKYESKTFFNLILMYFAQTNFQHKSQASPSKSVVMWTSMSYLGHRTWDPL